MEDWQQKRKRPQWINRTVKSIERDIMQEVKDCKIYNTFTVFGSYCN